MAGLPSGTVTFLFTDIEGSTSRWEHHAEAMRAALARHDALVRAAIQAHGGHVVKTMGDAFHAVFVRAPDAVKAALDAQRRLQAEPWGEVGTLRVRMSLYTGAAEERDGDYYGPALNRAARILSAGHGGQVLVSQATTELIRDEMPEGAALVDLGEHRLKDLIRPERVFQVNAPDLLSAFPPLTSLDTGRNRLPIQPTSLIGREDDVSSVRGLLCNGVARLVTLTGPGGTGKTRLGLQVAAELADEFSDGVVFVGLASIRDADLVAPTIGKALGIHDLGNRPILESLTAYLRDKRVLLMLDNFEQILPAAPVVAELLATCPGLRLLVTSRSPLHLRGEQEFPVAPLALPTPGVQMLTSTIATWPSVALFVQRASDVRPDFMLTDETAAPVAEICRRLDGLPLALELAAARIKLLSPEAMLARLERRLPLLTGGARDLPERQRTLRDAINWSYELLDPAEQRLLHRLSVFVGGWTFEAIEAVCDPDGALGVDVLDGIASLVDKSLVRQIEGVNHEPRFTMLETVREFATERLEAGGEAEHFRRRHAEYYLTFAEQARRLLRGPDARTWLDRFEVEHDNLRTALEWSESRIGRAETGADGAELLSGMELASRIAKACAWFWMLRGHLRQALGYVERLLASAPPGTSAHARALVVASGLHYYAGDSALALRRGEEGLAAWRSLGDRRQIAVALARVGEAYGQLRQADRATALLRECEALSDDARHVEDLEFPIVFALGKAARAAGNLESATPLFEQSAALSRSEGDHHTTIGTHRNLALIAQRRGEVERARKLHAEALRLADHLQDYSCMMQALAGLANVALEGGHAERAARLLSAAGRLHELTGMNLSTHSSAGSFEQAVAMLRTDLGDEAFQTAWSEGRAMTLEQAVAFALSVTGPTTTAPLTG